MKEMRAIHGFAKCVGMESKIKGTKLIVEGKRYELDDLKSVPEEITIEKAKTLEYKDSVIFQGHHSYLSNMVSSEVNYEGKKFSSAEVAFQLKKATVCGQKDEARNLEKINDPYMAKRSGHFIKETDEWRQKKEKIMKEILELKFKQNEDLQKKLVGTGDRKLYEGTSVKILGLWNTHC